jgi:hypothetical protein
MKDFVIKLVIIGLIAFFVWQGKKILDKSTAATTGTTSTSTAENMLNE